ncbi:MAG: hypothetical protein KC561_20850, partial [Myxococcales bacterium]|nr:hypothetical protein [Myxococcales bacterium]
MTAPIELPLKLKALNAAGPVMHFLGIYDIEDDPQYYMERASRAVGLSDFGPYDVETALGYLLYTLKYETDMSFFGRLSAN